MSHVSLKLGQFAYFDKQLGHPEWHGKSVLDFGGNAGNILKAPGVPIAEENYWSVDVSADGIAEGRRSFPNAHWIFYDRYNISFHPSGSKTARIPALGRRFDVITAYSVFTHMDVEEMDETVDGLLAMLSPGAPLAFTFIDHTFQSWPDEYPVTNLQWRLDRMALDPGRADRILEQAAREPWLRLAGDGDLYSGAASIASPKQYEGKPYHVFHTVEFMRAHFPNGRILPPANGEMQHCCVIRKDAPADEGKEAET